MNKQELEERKRSIESKLLLDSFQAPPRPITLSAHQFKKKFGTNQGYSEYKKQVKKERAEWDFLYKEIKIYESKKLKTLQKISLPNSLFDLAQKEAKKSNKNVEDILSEWLIKGSEKFQ